MTEIPLTGGQAGRRAMAEFHALGPVKALVSGRMVDLGAPKQRTLLALLVSQAGRAVTTNVILEALWDGNPSPSAMTSLQAYVAKLRKVLEPGRAPRTQATVLRTCARGYVLDAGAVFPHRPAPGPVAELLNGAAQQPTVGMEAAGGNPRLFDAIGRYLTGLSRTGALVVMLDHVHRADPASLRVLVHLPESVPKSRLLLIASYRSDEAPILAGTLAALSGAEPTRMELRGLTPRDTRVLASAIVGSEVSSRTAEGLCARSGGNPFFLREMIKLLAGEQRLDESHTAPVPAPVREVVRHRVERLPGPAAELLAVAAVAGRHFDVEVVADVASIEIDTALAVLDSAIAAGLIDEDKQRLGWFRFTDALVAEALYETTGRMRRGRLHLRIEAAAGGAWATERAAGGLAPAAIGPRTVGDRGHESAGPGPAGGTTMVMAMGGRRGRGVEQRTPSRRQPLKSPSQVAWPMLRQGVDFARLERNVA